MENKCKQEHRFIAIETSIKETKTSCSTNSKEIVELKESNAETKVYVKLILEKIEDLTKLFDKTEKMFEKTEREVKENSNQANSQWSKHANDLIKIIVLMSCFLAGAKYLKII